MSRSDSPGSDRKIARALISVFDKTGVVDFARKLSEAGVEIVSTGGTARALSEAGISVREVADLTGFPEMLDGRVKTLHPRVHGGLLARRGNADHMRQAREHGIEMIDLVAINLYPFEKTRREKPGEIDAIIEMIDIGGPAMVRSASKNYTDVVVLVDPGDYGRVIEEIGQQGTVSRSTRTRLAARAFAHTACYDAQIADFMRGLENSGVSFPDELALGFRKKLDLRYGENPHQAAALYADPLETTSSAVTAEKLQGKELSFNNILDLDAAWGLVCEFDQPACAVIKHTNPAGTAIGTDTADAWRQALSCDPVSAFGGIVAFNRTVSAEAADEMSRIFLEAIIAPGFEPAALEKLKGKKNLRLMRTGGDGAATVGLDSKRVVGGLLVQQRDRDRQDTGDFRVVTKRSPGPDEKEALYFAWKVARHVKSNAIVYARGTRTAGIGAGQMSRVDAVKFGAAKAAESLEGCVLASDAFFPFRDGVDEAARVGVTAIIQPGGSVKDDEVIAAADEQGIAMIFTGRRHFRH